MSRPLMILVAVLIVLIAVMAWGGSRTTAVPQTRVEKPVTNASAPR